MENSKVTTQFFTKRVEILHTKMYMKTQKTRKKETVKVKDLTNEGTFINYQDIKRLKATIHGYFGNAFSVTINLENGQIIWAQESGLYDEKVITISEEACKKFKEKLHQTNVLEWKSKYEKKNVVGGNKWNVRMDVPEGKVCKKGCNQYPVEWTLFCQLIEQVTGETFELN